jgi:Protein of unknown function (DUF3617)
MKNKILLLGCAAVLLSSSVALAGHGKAGLWNVTVSIVMPNMPKMPPEVVAMMKQRGMKMPGMGEPITDQVCMTQADVDGDMPPRTGGQDENCTNHVTSKTASSITADMVCTGRMQGTGHLQVIYSTPEHYVGSYNFKGVSEGHPQEMTSNFKGDYVKADCGAVKPFDHHPK